MHILGAHNRIIHSTAVREAEVKGWISYIHPLTSDYTRIEGFDTVSDAWLAARQLRRRFKRDHKLTVRGDAFTYHFPGNGIDSAITGTC